MSVGWHAASVGIGKFDLSVEFLCNTIVQTRKAAMYIEFDIDRESNLLVVLDSDQCGKLSALVYDLQDRQVISRIGNSFLPDHLEFSPNSKHLVFHSTHGRIYVHDIATGTTDVLFQDPALQAGFPTWSPDGTQVVFSAFGATRENPVPPHILCIDVGSRTVTKITDGISGDRFPQLSPCGRKVAFMRQHIDEPGMPGWICVADMETKEAKLLPRLGDAYCQVYKHCWSSDSSHLLITCNDNGSTRLHVVRLEDLEIIWSSNTDEPCVGAFSPCDNRILVATPSKLCWVSMPDGETIHRLSLTDVGSLRQTLCGGEIQLSADGRRVFFLVEDSSINRWDTDSRCVPLLKAPPAQHPEYDHSVYSVTARDGRTIPVHRFTPADPRPVVFEIVVGGPGGKVEGNDQNIMGLVAAGFEVIAPAYRGCDGHGDEHLKANVGQYGGADMLDVVDCLLRERLMTPSHRVCTIRSSRGMAKRHRVEE